MDDGGKVEVERSDGFTNGQERNLLLTAPLDGSSRFECEVELTFVPGQVQSHRLTMGNEVCKSSNRDGEDEAMGISL
jgi:hypothetical protein